MVIRALPPPSRQQRAAVVLNDLLGYRSDEAGRVLGLRPSTVRMHLSRGPRGPSEDHERGDMSEFREALAGAHRQAPPAPKDASNVWSDAATASAATGGRRRRRLPLLRSWRSAPSCRLRSEWRDLPRPSPPGISIGSSSRPMTSSSPVTSSTPILRGRRGRPRWPEPEGGGEPSPDPSVSRVRGRPGRALRSRTSAGRRVRGHPVEPRPAGDGRWTHRSERGIRDRHAHGRHGFPARSGEDVTVRREEG